MFGGQVAKHVLLGALSALLVSGCSHLLPVGQTQVAAIPAAEGDAPVVDTPATAAKPARHAGVDPLATLDRSAAARIRWQQRPPVDFKELDRPTGLMPAARAATAPIAGADPTGTASVAGKPPRSARSRTAPDPVADSEATLRSLESRGRSAVGTICSQC
ncbi:hypothetical protein [Methylobacterium nigriterrae]|uniref:hypothetical protein n=1 Tax=Methylobacterium nigriterrae TaxID=3127512 RepID=UPI003013B172